MGADLLEVKVEQVAIDRVEVRALDLVRPRAFCGWGEAGGRRGHLFCFHARRRRCESLSSAQLSAACVRRLRTSRRRRCRLWWRRCVVRSVSGSASPPEQSYEDLWQRFWHSPENSSASRALARPSCLIHSPACPRHTESTLPVLFGWLQLVSKVTCATVRLQRRLSERV